jgi:pimeloyl-ACP methyl ester carboxylesterase
VGTEKALRVGPSDIDIAYETMGDPGDPPVLLITGGGAQLINWPDGFCAELVARGHYVIRFDNRDTGRSTHLDDAPEPDLAAVMTGDLASIPYTLSDLADDAVGLLDALGLAGAHLVGTSLGGMIAQTVALEHPTRARSLTSMMSTTGALGVGQPDFMAIGPLGAPPDSRQGYIDWQVKAFRVVGSPGFEYDEAAVADLAGRSYDRGHDPMGMVRQSIAALASGDRTERLASLRLPALVVHGDADKMCDVSGGRATAAAIPGAELMIVPGMGHNLPRGVWDEIASRIAGLVKRAESG